MRFSCFCGTVFSVFLATGWLSGSVLAQGDSGFKYLEVTVVGPDEKPMAGVAVDVKIDGMEFAMPTDDEGKISLNAPGGAKSRLQLSVKHEGFVGVLVSWQGGKSFPEEFSIPLAKGEPVGGVVRDEQGEPVEGVKIESRVPGSTASDGKLRPLLSGHLATTDAAGRWQILMETGSETLLFLKPSHDEYRKYAFLGVPANWEELKSLEHVLVIEKGINLQGKVTNVEGEAIVGALVFMGNNRWGNDKQEIKTDAEGKYRFGNVAAGSPLVTVSAKGWAPVVRTVSTSKEMEPVDFQLERGKSIRILVTDAQDEPIAEVGVAVESWRGHETLPQEIYRGKTDRDGIWQLESMPAGEVKFSLFKRGHMSVRNTMLAASEETHTIVLPWALVVSGKVVDAESGLPLEKFEVVQGIDWGNARQATHWDRYNVKTGADGKYRTEFSEPRAWHFVRIEADGYRPGVSRVLRDNEGKVTIHFEMEEGTGPSGVVKTPEGKPAVGAKLLVATPEEGLYCNNGNVQTNRQKPPATTDEEGKYVLPFLDEGFVLICLHESGWARLSEKQVGKAREIELHAWSQVEGTLLEGKEPVVGERVRLYFNQRYVRGVPSVNWSYQVTSGADGKFRFDRVIGGEGTVARSVLFGDTSGNGSSMTTSSHGERVSLIAGETVQVQIGGTGRTIRGQLKVPKDYKESVAWKMGSVQMSEQPERVSGPQGFFHALGKAMAGGKSRLIQREKQPHRRSYASAIDAEGGFAIADVEPGGYRMSVTLYAKPVGEQYNWQPIGSLNERVTVAEAGEKEGLEGVDLGEFTLEMVESNPAGTNGTLQLNFQRAE